MFFILYATQNDSSLHICTMNLYITKAAWPDLDLTRAPVYILGDVSLPPYMGGGGLHSAPTPTPKHA